MAPQPLSPAVEITGDMANLTSVFIGHGANPEKHQSKLLHIYLVLSQPHRCQPRCRFRACAVRLRSPNPRPPSTCLAPGGGGSVITRKRLRQTTLLLVGGGRSRLGLQSPGAPSVHHCRMPSPPHSVPRPAATASSGQTATPGHPTARHERFVRPQPTIPLRFVPAYRSARRRPCVPPLRCFGCRMPV